MNTANTKTVSKDRIMEKIRAELNFRTSGVDNRQQEQIDNGLTQMAPLNSPMSEAALVQAHVPAKLALELRLSPPVSPQPAALTTLKEYKLAELLPYYDTDFINAAYRAILRRQPDPQGLAHYLDKLRRGAHKIEILGHLRYSQEGRKVGARVIGLASAFAKRRFYRIPIIGRIAEIGFGIWNLPNVERNHRANFNHAIRYGMEANARIQDSLQNSYNAISTIEQRFNVLLDMFESRIAQLESMTNNARVEALAQTKELGRIMQLTNRRRELAHGELVASVATKIGREALEPIEVGMHTLRAATDANRSATADSFGAIRQTQAQLGAVDAAQKNMLAAVTSYQSRLNKSLELLAESKADRASLNTLATSLQLFVDNKADQATVINLFETVRQEFARVANELRQADAALAMHKADQASIRTFSDQNNAAMRSLFSEVYSATQTAIHSKADVDKLESIKAELRQAINTGLASLESRVGEIASTKADKNVVNATHDEVRMSLRKSTRDLEQMLQSVAESKVEKAWVDAAIGKAQALSLATTQKTNDQMSAILRTKADRLALDVAQGELRASMRSLQSALDKLREQSDAESPSQSTPMGGVSNVSGTKQIDRIRGV